MAGLEPTLAVLPVLVVAGMFLKGVFLWMASQQVGLHDVSLEIPAGQFVAIIGLSGSGKPTIVDLVIGLFQPRGGDVYVDGVPLGEIDLMSWRKRIGYLPQDLLLFHDSTYKNVTLGDDSVSRQAVSTALEQARAADFAREAA